MLHKAGTGHFKNSFPSCKDNIAKKRAIIVLWRLLFILKNDIKILAVKDQNAKGGSV